MIGPFAGDIVNPQTGEVHVSNVSGCFQVHRHGDGILLRGRFDQPVRLVAWRLKWNVDGVFEMPLRLMGTSGEFQNDGPPKFEDSVSGQTALQAVRSFTG